MQLKYGTRYSFNVNGVKIQSTLETLKNEGGQPYATLQRMVVEGYLTTTSGTPQNDLTSQMSTLKTALSVWGSDLTLYNDDSTASGTSLVNKGSITGVQIVRGPEFPKTEGPEYASIRTFTFEAQAEYALATAPSLLDFTETLTVWGGGPEYAFRRAINAAPQKQLIWPATEFHCLQTGSAVGYLAFPTPPGPKFPNALMRLPKATKTSPKRRGQGYQGYAVTWEYEFQSATAFSAQPTLWVS